MEEIKVRWKKAALENCPGIPCITNTVPGAPTSVVATAGISSASIAFTPPTNNGGSAVTGYTVRSSPGGITAMGTNSPINVTGLVNGTVYTFTVVATNAVGNSVPSTASTAVTPAAASACPTLTITDVDGNIYNTVSIGTQCWTKENLKVTKYNNLTSIPLDNMYTVGLLSTVWENLTTGAYAIYNNELGTHQNVADYGLLYNWYAVTDSRKLCPTGYHVPTDAEWSTLIIHLDATASATTEGIQSTTAGTVLKENSNLWLTNTGTNISGFTARPGGYRNQGGTYRKITEDSFFWSATEFNTVSAWYREMYDDKNEIQRRKFDNNKAAGYSVRCLKD